MSRFSYSFEQFSIARYLIYWSVLIVPVSVATGSLVALFLWLLDLVTATRWQNLWLIFFLPLIGIFIYFLYRKYGKNSEAGNDLIIEEIHKPGGGVPARMTPLILVSAILTHLCGGSAGREGTAVQVGGSTAALFSRWYKMKHEDKRILLMCGMAAGFGAVFGTPVAGAVFAMEVLAMGRIKYDALVPCLIASMLADVTCAAYGIHHTQYRIIFSGKELISPVRHWLPHLSFNFILLFKVIAAGVAFGLTGHLFAILTRNVRKMAGRYLHPGWLVPVAGATAVIAISFALGSFDYLGLGDTNPHHGVSIVAAFYQGGATPWSWLWKLILTALTLGTGFKGGEVTPLFFIGATLGNTLAAISGAPTDLFAGLGFIAVFAGATNTPIACTLMGVELFGSDHVVYYAVACFTAYYFSGHSGIYGAQKSGWKIHEKEGKRVSNGR